MKHVLLSGLAAVAVLATVAETPAEAQTWRKYVDAYTGKSSNLNNRIRRRIDSALNRTRKYRNSDEAKTEDSKATKQPSSTVAALGNSQRKCPDGVSQDCPRVDTASDAP